MRSSMLLGSALLACFTACASTRQPQRLMEEVEDPQMSERQLRVALYDYLRTWSAAIEEAADRIARTSDDTALRRAAIRWKVEGVPACQTAVLRDDPVAGLLDTWALTLQMEDYFATGGGAGLFGDSQPIAVEAVRGLCVKVEDLADSLVGSGRADRGRTLVREWATANPIRGSILNRPTPDTVFAAFTEAGPVSALGAVRNLDQRIATLLERLDLYVATLPSQIRWQAEYVIELQVLTREEKIAALQAIDSLAESVEQLSGLSTDLDALAVREVENIKQLVRGEVDDLTQTLDRQRESITGALREERATMLANVDEQRQATLEALRAEREAAFAQVDDQRVALTETVRVEREALLGEIERMRAATIGDVDRLTSEAMRAGVGAGKEVLDHFFARGALFGGGGVLVLLLAGLLFVRLARRITP